MTPRALVARLRSTPPRETLFLAATLARGRLVRRRVGAGPLLQAAGKVRVYRTNGTIALGRRVLLWSDVKLSVRGDRHHAELTIGDGCTIGDRTELHCAERITLGRRCLVAWDVLIMDRDYHRLNADVEQSAPIVIGDNVWIGARATVLKGVTIGDGAVVAAAAVVTADVPPATLVAGNPARVIRENVSWAP